MAKGAGWMVLLRFLDRGIGVLSTAVLARLLLPEDFGLVALGLAVVGLVEVFADLNVDAALVRAQRSGVALFNTAWTINVSVGCVLAVVIVIGAHSAAAFFKEPRVAPLLYWLAIGTALGGFANIGTVEFQKELDFRRDFNFQFAARLLSVIAAIAAAYVIRNYWALVVGSLCRAVFRVGLSYLVHAYRPRFAIDGLRPLLSFSKWLLAENLVYGVNARISQIILGRLTAVDLLAFFSLGSEIARLATTEIQAPIRRAVYPGFAKVASDPNALARMYLSSAGILALVGLPVAVGIGVTADYAVMLLLGDRWAPVIPIVQILTFSGIILSLRTGSHLVYMAVGRPHLNLWPNAVGYD